MKYLLFFIFHFSFFISFTFSQITPPSIQWEHSYGGSNDDFATSIQQTFDGGYIIAGASNSNDFDVSVNHGGKDFWIVKIDSLGNIQWQKSLGGSRNDEAYSIVQAFDGGYFIAGSTYSNDGDVTGNHDTSGNHSDFWIVKLDTGGHLQWQKCYGGSGDEVAYSLLNTNDHGCIVAGYTASDDGDVLGNNGDTSFSYTSEDFWVIRIDSVGDLMWQKCLGTYLNDVATTINHTNDRGLVLAGYTYFYGTVDYLVVKIDSVGNFKWQRRLGGSFDDFCYSIYQTIDSGFVLNGFSQSNDGDVSGNHNSLGIYTDYWVVKLDTARNIQWQKCLGGTSNEIGTSVQQTGDRGYVLSGYTVSNDGDVSCNHGTSVWNADYWIVKLDTSGNIQWNTCLGGTGDDGYNVYFSVPIQQTSDGGFIVAGSSNSNDGDVTGNHGGYDYWVVKLGPAPMDIKENILSSDISFYPNPSSGKLTVKVPKDAISIEITNAFGQVIERRSVKGENEVMFDIKGNGMFFVQVVTDKETITKKLIITN